MNFLLRLFSLLTSLLSTSFSLAADCMATYDGQTLSIPCIQVAGAETIYQADLIQQAPEHLMFSTASVQAAMKLAPVEEIDIQILESFPVQVRVIAQGAFNDGCSQIEDVTINQQQQQFWVRLFMAAQTDKTCIQVITPFEYSVNLPVRGLKAGVYTVNVNGVTQTFELEQDNKIP